LNALRPEEPSLAIFASEHGDAFHFGWLRQDGEMRLNCLGAKLQGSSGPTRWFRWCSLGLEASWDPVRRSDDDGQPPPPSRP
jgi:hypothetical protein